MRSDSPTKRDDAGDPQGRRGCLNNMLWRARSLVVDTGIHAKQWTLQQGIDYGIAPDEVERYVVYPGQACAYMIGQLKIVELREKVRRSWATSFRSRPSTTTGSCGRSSDNCS